MSITVSDWYRSVQSKEVSFAAGDMGSRKVIQRIHFVEKADFVSFLKGGELIFTTGVAISDISEFVDLVKRCFSIGVSAIVVNTGTFIREIPDELIEFCNNNAFPIFTVPWHVHLEELMQISYKLISTEKISSNSTLNVLFENAIRFPELQNNYVDGLKDAGFKPKWKYCASIISFPPATYNVFNDVPREKVLDIVNSELQKESIPCHAFFSQQMLVIIFANVSTDAVERYISSLCKTLEMVLQLNSSLYYGIGRSTKSVTCIAKSYQLAEQILNMQENNRLSLDLHSYDGLGVYKVVMGLANSEILAELTKNYLTPLENYDRACGTDYCQFIQCFLKCDGRIKDISEHMFIHRNTVHYKIHKVEEILGCELQRADIKMYLLIAFMNANLV